MSSYKYWTIRTRHNPEVAIRGIFSMVSSRLYCYNIPVAVDSPRLIPQN